MKKKDYIWIIASIILLLAAALLIFPPHNTKDSDDIPAPNTTESSEEMQIFPKQDSGDVLAESGLGKKIQTTEEEKAGIEADMQEISKLCRADYLHADGIYTHGIFGFLNMMDKIISGRKT